MRAIARIVSLVALSCATLTSAGAAADTIDTYAGGGVSTADTTLRRELKLESPRAIATDPSGRVYVAETGRIWRIDGDTATRLAGDGTPAFAGDGGPAAAAKVGVIVGLAVASDGTVYFADQTALRVRRIDPDGIVTTIAGSGEGGQATSGGPGTTIAMGGVRALALDINERLHVGAGAYVWEMQDNGDLWPEVGGGSGSNCVDPEGNPTWIACLGGIFDIEFDNGNRLHVVSASDTVWYVDENGFMRRAARNVHADGTVGTATSMRGVAVDAYGSVFVSSHRQSRVSRFPAPESDVTIAGAGTAGFSGDGGDATAAALSSPSGLAVHGSTLYIADTGNGRIRAVAMAANPLPSRPVIPRVEEGSGEFLFWLRPSAMSGASPVTGYTIEAIADEPDSAPGTDPDAGTLEMGRVMRDLSRFSNYRFVVRAHNAHGTSAPSIPVRAGQLYYTWLEFEPNRVDMPEGDDGMTPVELTVRLRDGKTYPKDIVVEVNYGASAARGEDYVAPDPTMLTIPAGETSASFTVDVVGDTLYEMDDLLSLKLDYVSGPWTGRSDMLFYIRNDDPVPPPPDAPNAVPDRYDLIENAGTARLDVLGNDTINGPSLIGPLAFVALPGNGTVTRDSNGTEDPSDDVVRYDPPADWSGRDTFSYRLCYIDHCREATVSVEVRPLPPIALEVVDRAGHRDVEALSSRNRSAMALRTTALVPREITYPFQPHGGYFDPPADGKPRKVRLRADAHGGSPGVDFDLVVSVDANRDHFVAPDEVVCHSAMGARESCDVEIDQAGDEAVAYRVEIIQHGQGEWPTLDVFRIPLVPADDARLVATAPSVLARDALHEVRIGWRNLQGIRGAVGAGYVLVEEDGQPAGIVPVRIDHTDALPSSRSGVALVPGRLEHFMMRRGTQERRMFVDVPQGATRLEVTVYNTPDATLHLVPGAPTPGVATVDEAPAVSGTAVTGTGDWEKLVAVAEGPALHPGRWYVVLSLDADAEFDYALQLGAIAVVDAVAPVVRPGSYFNPDRSGHGLILYPAADQIAGLWYTYLQDGTPTWYYLQAGAPGANGLWNAGVYRATWVGDRNHLVRIGEAIVTPYSQGEFTFTHTVDGETGSEPMRALGRGCPQLGGQPLDASSHWFDPAHAGTGYSVQLWADYEFHAAFAYDAQGVARFLTAESGQFAGADATLVLEQLRGFCPTCAAATPTREPMGTLRRLFGANGLQRMLLDGMYVAPVAGDWIVDHAVVPLGGAGTTQGCAP